MSNALGTAHVVQKGKGADLYIYLSNFSIDRANLKNAHREALDRYVLPILVSGGSASILGIASRTGTWKHNLSLSNRRAQNARSHVTAWGALPGQLKTVVGTSEFYAAVEHLDGSESDFYRAVWVAASPKKVPPPPPPPPKIVPIPNKFKCVRGTLDRDFYDGVNDKEGWLFKGATGDAIALRLLIKRAEQEYSRDPAHPHHKYARPTRDNVLLSFYRSQEFRLWFTEGLCGLERFYKDSRRLKGAMDYIWYYNTIEGQKKKKVWDTIINKALKK